MKLRSSTCRMDGRMDGPLEGQHTKVNAMNGRRPSLSYHVNRSLQWRHNGHDCVSNHQPHHCLLNRLFGRRSKKTSKLRVTGFCAENVSIWWRHNVLPFLRPRYFELWLWNINVWSKCEVMQSAQYLSVILYLSKSHMSLLNWYSVVFTGHLSYTFIYMKSNIFSVCLKSGVFRHFQWRFIAVLILNLIVHIFVFSKNAPQL